MPLGTRAQWDTMMKRSLLTETRGNPDLKAARSMVIAWDELPQPEQERRFEVGLREGLGPFELINGATCERIAIIKFDVIIATFLRHAQSYLNHSMQRRNDSPKAANIAPSYKVAYVSSLKNGVYAKAESIVEKPRVERDVQRKARLESINDELAKLVCDITKKLFDHPYGNFRSLELSQLALTVYNDFKSAMSLLTDKLGQESLVSFTVTQQLQDDLDYLKQRFLVSSTALMQLFEDIEEDTKDGGTDKWW